MKFFYITIFLVLTTGCKSPEKISQNYQLSTQNTIKLSELKGNNYLQEVSLKNTKTSYTINQRIQLTVDTKDKEGYIYIFHIDNYENIALLYPNQNAPLVNKRSGKYLFPRDFGNIKIYAIKDCQKCVEEKTNVYAFLSKKPISNILEITAYELLKIFKNKYNSGCRGITLNLEDSSINTIDFSTGKLQLIVK